MKSSCWVALLALAAGCASGPKFSQVRSSIPDCAPEHGRIYVYRVSGFGAAVQPDVKLNGETIGKAQPKGAFYIDRPPGTYEMSTKTEVTRKLSLTLDKGQTRYVRLGISFGFFVGHVYPELVEQPVGEKEIQNCSYTGPKLGP